MDKMYNNLMDIVNRTKTIGGDKKVVKKVEKIERPESLDGEPIDEAVHTVRKSDTPKKSLFGDKSAISKLLSSSKAKEEKKPAKKATTKKTTEKESTKKSTKTTAKKTPTKSTKKTTTTKKTVTPKTPAKKPEEKKIPVEKEAPKLDLNDPKNLELYNALRSSLFSEGTDISDYIEKPQNEDNENKDILKELQAKKEAVRINQEISKEQQEYEELFNGSFGAPIEEAEEDPEEIARLQEFLRPKIEKEEYSPIEKTDVGKIDDEVEQKIADYYKKKNEKIEEFMKKELEDEPEEEVVDRYEDRQREYEDIFSGGVTTRNELMGIEPEVEEKELELESEEVETLEEDEVDETETEVEETYENVESENSEETDDDNMFTSFEYMENENSKNVEDDENLIIAENILPVESDLEEFMKSTNVEEVKDEVETMEETSEDSEEKPEIEEVDYEKLRAYNPFMYLNKKLETVHSSKIAEGNKTSEVSEEENIDNYNGEEIVEDANKDPEMSIIEKFHAIKEEDDYSKFNDVEESEDTNTTEFSYNDNAYNNFTENTESEDLEEDIEEDVEVTEEESDLVFLNKEKFLDDSEAYENELAKYIISDNMPNENSGEDYDRDNNTIVVDGDNLHKIDGVVVEDVLDDKEDDDDDTISKEEFYNEMARLQENLINELKGNKVEDGVDLFEEKEEDKIKTEEKKEESEEVVEEKELTEEEKIEKLVEGIVYDILREEKLQRIVDGVVEENHKYDDFDLLGKDAPLGEDDLEYIRKNKEKEEDLKDKYFYLSAEDNEKKAEIEDAYMDMYNDEVNGNIREMGDINLNKDISNPVSYSEEYSFVEEKDSKDKTTDEDSELTEEEMESIYTLFGIERKKVVKMEKEMKVLYVASECQPFIATGGLADVAGSVTKELAKNGVDCRVIMPLYGSVKEKYKDKLEYIGNFTVHLSWRQEYCGLFRIYQDGVTFYFVDNERYFNREKTYGYYDDGERFAYFSKAIVESLPIINFFPDIIHCNDWQSALVSVYIKTGNWSDHRYYKIKHVYTIHNIEYQGVYGMENLKDLFGIDFRFKNDLEYNGDINLSKAAIQYSDKFTTVSDSYCDNLKEPYCSRGLHHIIIRNEHKLCGILNGLDYDFYHPSIDKNLYKNYSIDTIEDKVVNKKLWQDELGLPVDGDTPMLSIVSRLVSLKGLGLVTRIAEDFLQKDVQLVIVGTGDEKYVEYFRSLEQKYPTKVRALCDKYSNELARKAYGASDIFIMPSKVEPCGISQMISSAYGSVPIVRETGGLKDTIKDFGCEEGGNGYTFNSYNHNDLLYQINRAIKDYGDKAGWRKKMEICMSMDFSWTKSVKKYIDLYKSLMD